jgi:hypothetical protein
MGIFQTESLPPHRKTEVVTGFIEAGTDFSEAGTDLLFVV